MITILLADDHLMFRSLLARRLEDESDMSVVSSVGDATIAVRESIRLKPRIAILDIVMPGIHVFEAAEEIQKKSLQTRILFLSGYVRDSYIEQAFRVEAWGYLLKTDSDSSLIQAIRNIHAGYLAYAPCIQSRIVQAEEGRAKPGQTLLSTLTRREMEVLGYISQGLSEKEIGNALRISLNTVHRHTVNLMRKLDIHNRIELVRFAIREGLVEA